MPLDNNEKRQMNEVVDFYNGSDVSLDLTYGNETYGVVKAHNTVKAPRFVAEYWAKRNLLYKVVEDSPESQMIEAEKQELAGVEQIYDAQNQQNKDTLKQAQEIVAAKAIVEGAKAQGDTPPAK
jgi:hypothetical protein